MRITKRFYKILPKKQKSTVLLLSCRQSIYVCSLGTKLHTLFSKHKGMTYAIIVQIIVCHMRYNYHYYYYWEENGQGKKGTKIALI